MCKFEIKLGDVFKIDTQSFQCVKRDDSTCKHCAFNNYEDMCDMVHCFDYKRSDGQDVHFIKVGE